MRLALAGGWHCVQVHRGWCFVLGALQTFGCTSPPAPILFLLSHLSITTFLHKDCALGLVSCKLVSHMAAIVPGQHLGFRCCHCKHAMPNTTWILRDASRTCSPGSGVDSPYLALKMLFGAAGMGTYLHYMPLYWLGGGSGLWKLDIWYLHLINFI